MKKWKITAGLLTLFLSGVVVGAVGTGGFIQHILSPMDRGNRPHPVKMIVMKNIEERFDIDDATKNRISEEIDVSIEEIRDLRKQFSPELTKVLDRFLQRTAAFLAPENQDALAQLIDDFKHHRQDRLVGPTWPLPMPPPMWDTPPPPPHGNMPPPPRGRPKE